MSDYDFALHAPPGKCDIRTENEVTMLTAECPDETADIHCGKCTAFLREVAKRWNEHKRIAGLWDIIHCLSCKHDCQGEHRDCAGWTPEIAAGLLVEKMVAERGSASEGKDD